MPDDGINKLLELANLAQVADADYLGSSLRDVYKDLHNNVKGSDAQANSFREIVDGIRANENVPHDDSILGPAAYFVDLLRMVLDKESTASDVADTHKLMTRRGDLKKLPLLGKDTLKQVPYLTLVNDLIKGRLAEVYGNTATAEIGLASAVGYPLPFNASLAKMRAILPHLGTDFASVLDAFSETSEAAPLARLGLTKQTLEWLANEGTHKNFATLLTDVEITAALKEHALPELMAAYGISAEIHTKLPEIHNGTEWSLSAQVWLSNYLLKAVKTASDGGQFEGLEITRVKDTGSFIATIYQGQDEGKRAANPAEYNALFGALLRVQYLASKLDWTTQELCQIIGTTEDTALTTALVSKLAKMNTLRLRFKVPVEHAPLLFAFGEPTAVNTMARGDHELFAKLFKGFSPDQTVTFGTLPSNLGAVCDIAQSELIYPLEMLTPWRSHNVESLNTPAVLSQKMIVTIWQFGQLARGLGRPVSEVVEIARGVANGIDKDHALTLADIYAIADYADWATTLKIPFSQLAAMAANHTKAICHTSDVNALTMQLQSVIEADDAQGDDAGAFDEVLETKNAIGKIYNLNQDQTDAFFDYWIEKEAFAHLAAEFCGGVYDNYNPEHFRDDAALILFSNLLRKIQIIKTFDVNGEGMALVLHPTISGEYRTTEPRDCGLQVIRNLDWVNRLKCDQGIDFYTKIDSAVLNGQSPEETAKTLSALTGLHTVDCALIFPNFPDQYKDDIEDETSLDESMHALIQRAQKLAKICHITGASAAQVKAVSQLYNSIVGADSDTAQKNWADQDALVAEWFDRLKTKLSDDTWQQTAAEIDGQVQASLRDCLVPALIRALNMAGSGHHVKGALASFADLSDELLVDVEMGPEVQIAPVKLGLNSLQRYIRRALTGQEGRPAPLALTETEWTWRAHYRLWEANRKVFLYPENFLDPSLRRNKTPEFTELQGELLQGDVTKDAAERVFLSYLDRLEKLAELEIVSACADTVQTPGKSAGTKTLFLIGKSNRSPAEYYIRSAAMTEDLEVSHWQPWVKIPLAIQADRVCLGFLHNRVHIFWLEHFDVRDGHDSYKTISSRANIKFSRQTLNGGWTEPRDAHGGDFRGVANATRKKGATEWEKGWTLHTVEDQETRPIGFPMEHPEILFTLELPDPTDELKKSLPAFRAKLNVIHDLTTPLSKDKTVAENNLATTGNWSTQFCFSAQWQESYRMRLATGATHWDKENKEVTESICGWDVMLSRDQKTVFAAVSAGEAAPKVYRSTDAGLSWHTSLSTSDDSTALAASPAAKKLYTCAASNVIYGNNETEIFRSDTQGDSWHSLELWENPNIQTVSISDDGNTIVALDKDTNGTLRMHISKNAGVEWADIKAPLRQYAGALRGDEYQIPTAVCINATGAQIILATDTNYHYYSDDMGENWFPSSAPEFLKGPTMRLERDASGVIHGFGPTGAWTSSNSGEIWNIEPHFADMTVKSMAQIFGVRAYIVDSTVYFYTFGVWVSYSNISGDIATVCSTGRGGGNIIADRKKGLMYNLPTRAFSLNLTEEPNRAGQALYRLTGDENNPVSRTPLTTQAPHHLSETLLTQGLTEMLSLQTQSARIETDSATNAPALMDFSISGPYAIYFREIFFHLPYLIGDSLNRNRQFEDAQSWYHKIFRPDLIGDQYDPQDNKPFWRYRPFKKYNLVNLNTFSQGELAIYEDDPFDAHAVAGLRLGAYERAVLMRYVDNLLDWGDHLFAQDSWESITEAMVHYQKAQELLGAETPHKPNSALPSNDGMTYEKFIADYEARAETGASFHHQDINAFPILRNTSFHDYRALIKKRIGEIRSSEDITGLRRQLALFQPAIDPRSIMEALSSGLDLAHAFEAATSGGTRYRFKTSLANALEMVTMVKQLGSRLLSALQSKDTEGMSHLQRVHQDSILTMLDKTKQQAIKAAKMRRENAISSQKAAEVRKSHFDKLAEDGLNAAEKKADITNMTSLGMHGLVADIRTGSIGGYLSPNIFGTADGGQNAGRAIEVGAGAMDSMIAMLNQSASMIQTKGQNDRRAQDWAWESAQAEAEMDRIGNTLNELDIAIEMAEFDRQMHQRNVQQQQEMESYIMARFANQDLFSWLAQKLTSLYFQSFSMALSFARDASMAFEAERGTPSHLTLPKPLTSLRGGLLAGDELQLWLMQLKKEYMDAGAERLEIEKVISLSTVAGDKNIGPLVCKDWATRADHKALPISLPKDLFSDDGQGAKPRKILSVAVSLYAIVGPFQTFNATLTHSETKRKIAISRGSDDEGILDQSFYQDRYKPFEGTDVNDSEWSLEFHKEDDVLQETLSDVVLRIRYWVPSGSEGQ